MRQDSSMGSLCWGERIRGYPIISPDPARSSRWPFDYLIWVVWGGTLNILSFCPIVETYNFPVPSEVLDTSMACFVWLLCKEYL